MHEYLTRALELARKCRESVVLACGRIIDRIRWKAPVVRHAIRLRLQKIRDETSRLCRLGLEYAGRFIYRLYFIADVLCIRIADWLRYWTPIVRDRISGIYLLCVARTWRFVYRLYFSGDVICIRIADWFRYWTPIVTLAITDFYLLCLARTWRFLYRLYFTGDVLYIRIADWFRYWTPIVTLAITDFYLLCLARTWRFIYRIYFFVDVLCIKIAEWFRYWTPIVRDRTSGAYRRCLERSTRFVYRLYFVVSVFCIKIAEWFRHWTPIVLHFFSTQAQNIGKALSTFIRALVRHTTNVSRAIVHGVVNTSVRIFRLIYGSFRSVTLSVLAGCRWFAGRVRHNVPLLLQAAGRGLQAAVQGITRSCRAGLLLAARIIRATAQGISSAIAAVINVLRKLLLAIIVLLRLIARAILASTRFILRSAALAVAGLWRQLRILSARAGERLYQYALLMRLHKPIGIFLLLWPTLWALWIAADGMPDLPILLIFVSGVVLMRSAGVIINDYADRDFDAQVSRTKDRPLASGKVTPKEALEVAALLVLCAFLLVLQLNLLTIGLSMIGIVLAVIYPLTKRYTYMPQFFLGLAFGWAVPMAFAAQTGAVPAMGWILMLATVLWALVYDTMYAMVDREEDIELGIKSTAILFEEADRVIIGIIQLLVVLTLLLIGSRLDFNRYYYAGLAIAALLFLYQQHLIWDRSPQHCFMAFLNNNWFGAIVFCGIFMNYYYV